MALNIGLDMRGTSGYVTDPSSPINCTYTLGGTGGDAYPVTRAGSTFGWDPTGSGSVFFGADRNSGNDARIAGIVFRAAGASRAFKFDLPNAGTYDIYLGIGDALGGTSQTTITIIDNVTTLWSVTQVSTGTNDFTDAQGNEYSAANWPSSQQPRAATFASTTMFMEIGTSPPNQGLAFLGIVEQTSGGSTYSGYQQPFGWNRNKKFRNPLEEKYLREHRHVPIIGKAA